MTNLVNQACWSTLQNLTLGFKLFWKFKSSSRAN